MLRRHFITGTELPDFIITYHAPEHVPFWCGMKKRNINSVLNYDGSVLDDGTDGFKTPVIFDIVLDKWQDGVGEWGVKIKNTTQMSYYSTIQEGSFDNPESLKMGTADYYGDQVNINLNYANKITNIIFPEGLTHINGSPLYSSDKNTSCLSITLPDSIEYLTGSLFGNYDSLKYITIPSNVKRIDNLCYVCGGNGSLSNSSLEEVILKPLIPPDSSYSNNPLGTYYEDKVYNNLKIRVYADCIETYKNDAVWGLYSNLYAGIKNKVITYTNDNRNIEHVDLINHLYNYTDYEKLYITSELSSDVSHSEFTRLSAKYLYIENSKYDSRNNCNAIIETETNTLLKGTENTIIPNTVTHIGSTKISNHYVFKPNNVPNTLNIPDSVMRVYYGAFDTITFSNLIIGKNCEFDNFNFSVTNTITVPKNHISYLPSTNNIISKNNTLYKGTNNTIIPDYITSIISNAFIGNHISYLDTNTVTDIYQDAFINCKIEHLYISELCNKFVTYQSDDRVFTNTVVNNITISENNTYFRIENNNLIQNEDNILIKAFNNTDVIPVSVEKIGSQAYYGQNITSINIPTNIKSIHHSAFTNTPIETNNNYWINDSLWCVDDWLLNIKLKEPISELTIPANITKIGTIEYSYLNSQLNTITFSGNVECISDNAFKSWPLNIINMNSAVNLKYIGDYAFAYSGIHIFSTLGCSNLYIGEGAFAGCKLLNYISISSNVTSIGKSAFNGCTDLESVIFLDDNDYAKLQTIEPNTFYNCNKLKSITIPNSVTSIGEDAFRQCSSLTSVTIGESVTSIGDAAFRDCSKLTSVTIPNSVTSIGWWAFADCSSLTSITFNGTKMQWNSIELGDWSISHTVTVVHCTDGDIEI